MRQVRDGLVGGACAVLPLVVVNVLGYAGLLDSRVALLAGALALFGGPLLGGVVAGLLAGRAQHVSIPLVTGMLAGGVYLVVLLALVVVALQTGTEPPILAEHPLRVGGAMVSLATLLAMVTLGIGWLARRGAPSLQRPMAGRPATPSAARPLRPSAGRSTGRGAAARPVTSDARARATRSGSALPSDRRR